MNNSNSNKELGVGNLSAKTNQNENFDRLKT